MVVMKLVVNVSSQKRMRRHDLPPPLEPTVRHFMITSYVVALLKRDMTRSKSARQLKSFQTKTEWRHIVW
jgi:hypothetical protein